MKQRTTADWIKRHPDGQRKVRPLGPRESLLASAATMMAIGATNLMIAYGLVSLDAAVVVTGPVFLGLGLWLAVWAVWRLP